MPPFDLARLFELPRPPRQVTTDAAELAAVARGAKPMALFVGDDDEVARWIADAGTRGLVASCHADPQLGETHVFVTRADQLWRVPAYLALWETAFVDGRWSDAAENLASYLLGYSRPARAAWLARQRQAFPAWTATTVYTLLDDTQRSLVEALGRRCFGTTAQLVGIRLFTPRGRVLRDRALAQLPRGHTLARAGLDGATATRLFGARVDHVLTKRDARLINPALRSNVQYLTKTGWR